MLDDGGSHDSSVSYDGDDNSSGGSRCYNGGHNGEQNFSISFTPPITFVNPFPPPPCPSLLFIVILLYPMSFTIAHLSILSLLLSLLLLPLPSFMSRCRRVFVGSFLCHLILSKYPPHPYPIHDLPTPMPPLSSKVLL